jgi:hypothetical protein
MWVSHTLATVAAIYTGFCVCLVNWVSYTGVAMIIIFTVRFVLCEAALLLKTVFVIITLCSHEVQAKKNEAVNHRSVVQRDTSRWQYFEGWNCKNKQSTNEKCRGVASEYDDSPSIWRHISGPIEIPELWRIYPGILYRSVSGWELRGAESPEQLCDSAATLQHRTWRLAVVSLVLFRVPANGTVPQQSLYVC